MLFSVGNGTARQADVFIHLVFEYGEPGEVPFALRPEMKKKGVVTWFYSRSEQESHVLIVGLGKRENYGLEALREAAGTAGRAVEQERLDTVSVSLASVEAILAEGQQAEQTITAWVEGWLLGMYAFDRYQSNKRTRRVGKVHIASPAATLANWQHAVEQGVLRAEATSWTRDLVNEPPNVLTPVSFVDKIRERFAMRDVELTVYQGEELERLKMVGLIAVGKGSGYPAAMVEIRYCTEPELPLTALIGKGVTFDMGGMNVKTGRDISDARFDMGGAAAVLGALDILTKNKERANLVVLVPIAENVPDGGAFLPSHVIQYPNGLSVQAANTDAEGRLILADALIHAKRLGAEQVIDIATLTGNVGEALGLKLAGIWGDPHMTQELMSTGEKCGDLLWPMPLVDDYEELLKSDYADMTTISPIPYGGAIVAALFLRRFVADSMRWVHIDMAPPVQVRSTRGYHPAGATGYGARLLADYLAAQS